MKPIAILLVILLSALLVQAAAPYSQFIFIAALIAALALVVMLLTAAKPEPVIVEKPVVAEAVKPVAPAAPPQNSAQAEIVTLLGIFQEKGRLVDFLMEDITPYSDEQVGSVARAVHQGCKAALNEHFTIEAIATGGEGASVTVPAGYAADEFRLTGNLSGEAPFTGTLVHKGWKTTSVKLPRVLKPGHVPAIAPAQVEVS